jgi:hypothetical protein
MESTSRSGLFKSHTEDSYSVYRKKFADFLGFDFNPTETLPGNCFTDDNVACFLSNIGKETEFKVLNL